MKQFAWLNYQSSLANLYHILNSRYYHKRHAHLIPTSTITLRQLYSIQIENPSKVSPHYISSLFPGQFQYLERQCDFLSPSPVSHCRLSEKLTYFLEGKYARIIRQHFPLRLTYVLLSLRGESNKTAGTIPSSTSTVADIDTPVELVFSFDRVAILTWGPTTCIVLASY